MVLDKKLLILEDDLLTLSKILDRLATLEQEQPYEFSTIVLSDYIQVEDYVNHNPKAQFDVILLDRDCKLGGSFHILDIERFGAKKVIAISSVPKWNEDARKRGVKRVIEKDFLNLDEFADNVVKEIEIMIRGSILKNLKKFIKNSRNLTS